MAAHVGQRVESHPFAPVINAEVVGPTVVIGIVCGVIDVFVAGDRGSAAVGVSIQRLPFRCAACCAEAMKDAFGLKDGVDFHRSQHGLGFAGNNGVKHPSGHGFRRLRTFRKMWECLVQSRVTPHGERGSDVSAFRP